LSNYMEQLKGRYAVLGVVILAVLGLLLAQLWSMQVLNGSAYAKQAVQNRTREVTMAAPRGRILDVNGVALVTNRATMAVYVDPVAKDDTELLERLSSAIGVPVADITSALEDVREQVLAPRLVAADVSMEVAAYISEHAAIFPGVEVREQASRAYPQGTMAAHVLGYIGQASESDLAKTNAQYERGDLIGKSGAELQFDSVLRGDRGTKVYEVNATGKATNLIKEVGAVAGSDVQLTIDSGVQAVTENALAQALDDAHGDGYTSAKGAAAVVVNVKTGAIVAMASLPTYDPSAFLNGISNAEWEALTSKDSEYPLTNRVTMGQYPAASTFKAIVGLAGLESDLISTSTTYECKGSWTEMGTQWRKRCWSRSGHGVETFTEAMRDSCDIYFYNIGYLFYKEGDEGLQAYARRFGFGSKSGIDLPSEAAGRVPDAAWKADYNEDYPENQQWLPGDTVNLSIGQGDLLVTPLQLVNSYAGLANGGRIMTPHVLQAVLGVDGEPVLTYEPTIAYETGASAKDLAAMNTALVAVTQQGGTAYGAFRNFPVTVAGKTGTAEVAGKDDYAWFAGYAPAGDPEYAVAVIVEQGGHGGSIAGPVARQIFAALFGEKIEHVTATDVSR
jgi:penicillin-binding protein 2